MFLSEEHKKEIEYKLKLEFDKELDNKLKNLIKLDNGNEITYV